MSGGSFNYLYAQDPYVEEDLREMAEDLRMRGMWEAEEETLALIPKRASKELAELWRNVEWHRSNDYSEAQVALAYAKYSSARNVELNPPG